MGQIEDLKKRTQTPCGLGPYYRM